MIPGIKDICLAPDFETVCYCSNVTKPDILRAKQKGAASLADIKKMTGACTQGRCRQVSPVAANAHGKSASSSERGKKPCRQPNKDLIPFNDSIYHCGSK